MRTSIMTLIGLLVLALSFCALGIEMRKLCLEELTPFPAEALKHYEKGLKHYDHVNYDRALEEFHQAVRIYPHCTEFNFFTARLAMERAEIHLGEQATKLYSLAEQVLNVVLKNPRASEENKERARRKLDQVQKERARLPEVEARRMEIGKKLIEAKLEMRAAREEAAEKLKEEAMQQAQQLQQAATGGSAPGLQPMRGAGGGEIAGAGP